MSTIGLVSEATAWYDVRDYGATGDGTTDDATAIQAALTAGTGGTVLLPGGLTFVIDVALTIPAGTTLWGYGATLKLKDNATYTSGGLVLAGGADVAIRGLTLDGNRANNASTLTFANFAIPVWIADYDDCRVVDCTVSDAAWGVYVGDGKRAVIEGNRFDNVAFTAVSVGDSTPGTESNSRIVSNIFSGIGYHAIEVKNVERVQVIGNDAVGNLTSGLVVDTSGTAVTATTGSFANLKVGNFLIVNGGTEYLITAIADSTHLTLSTSAGTNTGWDAAGGTGDVINVQDASDVVVRGNRVESGVGGAIVVYSLAATVSRNVIDGNVTLNTGGGAISLQRAGGALVGTSVTDNVVANAGLTGSAGAAAYYGGINVQNVSVTKTWVSGNRIEDDQAPATTRAWLVIDSNVAAGEVAVGRNSSRGMLNQGIENGVSIALNADWGASAAVSGIVCEGTSYRFRVTSDGAGTGSGATLTVTTRAIPGSGVPQPVCTLISYSATSLAPLTYLVAVPTIGSSIFTMTGTPAGGGATYDFIVTM